MNSQNESRAGTVGGWYEHGGAGVLLISGVIANWLLMLHRSLWIDEFLSVAVIHGSWRTFLQNASEWLYSSPLTFIPYWAIGRFSLGEAPLRAVSVVGVAVAALLVHRWLRRYFAAAPAMVGLVAFLVHPDVAAAAINVRPYAWSLVPVAGSFLALSAWLQTGRRRFGVSYAVATALIPYGHPLFAAVIPAHAVLFACEPHRDARVTPARGAAAFLVAVVGWLPLVPRMMSTFGLRHELTIIADETMGYFLLELVRPLSVTTMLVLAGWTSTRWLLQWIRLRLPGSASKFALVWFALVACAPWSAPVFVVHAVALLRRRGEARWPHMVAVGMGAVIAAAAVAAHRFQIGYVTQALPTFGEELLGVRHEFLVRGTSAMLALALFGTIFFEHRRNLGDGRVLAFGAAYLIPFWILFAGTAFSGSSLFVDRYLLSSAVGFAGLAAWIAERFDFAGRWTLAAVLAMAGSIYVHLPIPYTNDDRWPAIAALCNAASPDTRIALNASLNEGNLPLWHSDPRRANALLVPLRYYGVRRPIILLPFRGDRPEIAEWSERALNEMRSVAAPIIVVDNLPPPNDVDWLMGALAPGFKMVSRTRVGWTSVARFEPVPPTPGPADQRADPGGLAPITTR